MNAVPIFFITMLSIILLSTGSTVNAPTVFAARPESTIRIDFPATYCDLGVDDPHASGTVQGDISVHSSTSCFSTEGGGRTKAALIQMTTVLRYSPVPGDYVALSTIETCVGPKQVSRYSLTWPCHSLSRGDGVYQSETTATITVDGIQKQGTTKNSKWVKCPTAPPTA